MAARRKASNVAAPKPDVEEIEQSEDSPETGEPEVEETPEPETGEPEVEVSSEVVLLPFAYVVAKNGEVVQLVKGDIIDADRFKDSSLEHLRGIGFIGNSK